MSQFSLFVGQGKDDSYGLETFQFYNWGTYDNQINEISPNLLASWLTGLNGAGKSTVLDGLSTLLTPSIKRQYNMSSGAEKGERSERTYVKGAWGEERDQASQQDGVKYLRGEESYTVLMARFRTAKSKRSFTLAQVLWLTGDKVQKLLITSTKDLTIAEDLSDFGTIKGLKIRLKDLEGVRIYDSFADYCNSFMKVFGMRSVRAVELINKTASMKEVESLTDFMRSHMLDKHDMSGPVNELISHFKVAEDAHRNFEKARIQTQILSPIESNSKVYDGITKELNLLETQLDIIPPYISNRLISILEEKERRERDEITILSDKKLALETKLNNLTEELRLVQLQLAGEKSAHQIQLLEVEKGTLEKEIITIKTNLEKYNSTASKLSFHINPDSSQFLGNKRKAETASSEATTLLQTLQGKIEKATITYSEEVKEAESLRKELAAIEKRQSNIPSQNLHIRSFICESLNIPESELPFAGELVKVNEKVWEGSIERLLRNFGLLLLVDDSKYEKVARFINSHNLKGKLEFERVETNERFETSPSKTDGLFIYSKIDVKPDSRFRDWIKFNLKKRFNYICCDSVDDLMNAERGITREGFIRHSQGRHVKDDRPNIGSPSSYVLGWNNKDKIAILQKQLQLRLLNVAEAQGIITTSRKQSDVANETKRLTDNLLFFEAHKLVDLTAPQNRIIEINSKIKEFISSSKSLKKLKSQEESICEQLSKGREKQEDLIGDIRSHKDELDRTENEIISRKREVSTADSEISAIHFPILDNLSESLAINFSKDKPERIKDMLSKQTTSRKEELTAARTSAATSITNAMRTFKDKFSEDSTDLLVSLDFRVSFIEIYKKLVDDDLPRFEAEYRKMFTKDVLDRVTLLYSELFKVEAEIKEAVEFINTPLETVNFNLGTKIRILAHTSNDRVIKEFQLRIKDCLPKITGLIEQSDQDEAFSKVKSLVEYLQLPEKERERVKVLDVRNWVDFAAQEIDRKSNTPVQYYSGAAGRSGGQKAQLAFTVLASALAYQCGLTADAPSQESFNFVMIDEAFAKTDSMKSDMALKLFKNMGFQILVSSPDRDWDIVEPHVDCVHLAYGTNERDHSEVYTITLQEASLQLGRPLGKKIKMETRVELLQ